MTMAAPPERATERGLARVAELKHVLQHLQSADVRDTVEAAIAAIERRYGVASDPAISPVGTPSYDQQSGRLAVE
jgi:hypothetical protein